MKKIITLVFIVFIFFACKSELTLQQYFVEKSEDSNFLALDVPASILGIASSDLSEKQLEAYESFQKLNMLIFKKTSNNANDFIQEKETLKTLFSQEKFNSLITLSDKKYKGEVMYLGDDESVDEVIVYGDMSETGFVVIRVLGSDMKPENIASFASLLQEVNMDKELQGSIFDIFKSQ